MVMKICGKTNNFIVIGIVLQHQTDYIAEVVEEDIPRL